MELVRWIEPELYDRIKQVMPILCVDLLIHRGNQFLVLLRKNEPAKGLWWTPGGRVLKGETLMEAAHRKAWEELKICVEIEKMVGIYDQFWDTSTSGESIHTPDIYFLARPFDTKIEMDEQHSEYRWVSSLKGLHPYVTQAVIDSGILGRGQR